MYSLASKKVTRVEQIIKNIASDFSLDKLSKSPARFNLKKLEWFNSEYIKQLSLLEFSYRVDKLKFNSKLDEGSRVRVGDYVYLVDLEKDLIFGEKWEHIWPDGDGYFYPLGGGREEDETSKNCAVREVLEESNNQIKVDPDKLILITKRVFKFSKPTMIENQLWDAKEFNYYFYPLNTDGVESSVGDNNADCCWQSFSDVLGQNKFITYSIWYNFCQENNLPIPNPSNLSLKKLLAYKLDQNRIVKLDQAGIESGVICNYAPLEKEAIRWKKDTLEGSCSKLRELFDNFIDKDELWAEFATKFDVDDYENYLEDSSNWWAELIKQFMNDNNLDYGEYLWPLRLALSGQLKSASAFEILVIIGQEEATRRIKNYL